MGTVPVCFFGEHVRIFTIRTGGFRTRLLAAKKFPLVSSLPSQRGVVFLRHLRQIAVFPKIHENEIDVRSQKLGARIDKSGRCRMLVERLRGRLRGRRDKVVQSHKYVVVDPVVSQLAGIQSVLDARDVQVLPVVVGGVVVVEVQSIGTRCRIGVAVGAVVMEHDDALRLTIRTKRTS